MLIGLPVPEELAIPNEQIEPIIIRALKMAEDQGIRGKAITPFLLQHVADLSEGESMKTNIALLKNNARVASLIAREL